MIDKNLCQFAEKNWCDYEVTITEASKNNKKIPLVKSEDIIYNFDSISKEIYSKDNPPSSADGIRFRKSVIELIEFKSGFKQKVSKDKFDPEKGQCEKIGELCNDYWKLFWDNQDRKRSELIESIRVKAIESYILLEKHIFPICESETTGKISNLIFTVVIDDDGVDGIEDTLAELSSTEAKTNNNLTAIRQALKRLLNRRDINNSPYFYDRIEVMTSKDFENQLLIGNKTT